MATSPMTNNNPEQFNYDSVNPVNSSQSFYGWYYPETKCVEIMFYFVSSSNIGTAAMFTIPQKYRPSSNKGGISIIGQATLGGNRFPGTCSVNSSGEIYQGATATCYNCFGIIKYQL